MLNLGCGNSIFSEQMYDDEYLHIFNMDISQFCIDQMKERNEISRPKMKWQVMSAMDLKFSDNSFDLIVDKGTVDALICGGDG